MSVQIHGLAVNMAVESDSVDAFLTVSAGEA